MDYLGCPINIDLYFKYLPSLCEFLNDCKGDVNPIHIFNNQILRESIVRRKCGRFSRFLENEEIVPIFQGLSTHIFISYEYWGKSVIVITLRNKSREYIVHTVPCYGLISGIHLQGDLLDMTVKKNRWMRFTMIDENYETHHCKFNLITGKTKKGQANPATLPSVDFTKYTSIIKRTRYGAGQTFQQLKYVGIVTNMEYCIIARKFDRARENSSSS